MSGRNGLVGQSPDASGLIEDYAAFAADALATGLPERRDRAVRAVLDTLGVAAAGIPAPVHRIATDVVRQWGRQDTATALGVAERLPAASAAFVNGVLAHCSDFDDTHLPSVLHPSSSVVPAALAAGEAAGAPGPRLLDAVELGTELTVRLGLAGYDRDRRDSVYFDRGLHATSLCGAVGAAAAAALLSGRAEVIAAAAGIAASMGSGVLESNRTGGSVKQIHAGWAAHCGVAAAQLAGAGLTASPTVLEGRFGFLRAFCGPDADVEVVGAGLGELWHTDAVHIKPYPCNHFTHCGIDAALELRARGVRPEDVRELRLGVPAPVLRTIAEPPAGKARPATGYAGAFSGPYTVAAALFGGGDLGLGAEDFTDAAVARPEVLALAAKVVCQADPECTAVFPDQFPARLSALLADGRTETVYVATNRGGPRRRLADADLDRKFALNAGRAFAPAVAERLAARIRALAQDATPASVGALFRAAAGPPGPATVPEPVSQRRR
ncbi:MAG: MmgE/PrpD family protein [Catenulispora sp.]